MVLAGAIFDLIRQRISKKQGIITIGVSLVFFVLVGLSHWTFEGLL
ncbi:MAG: hypothetical protein LBP53_07880 [Candidatus Peribacteria bacterium]|nr:hypothetical protein [Candidatus Peribacteria bacterium]